MPKTGSEKYHGITINKYVGKPPGADYLKPRVYYKVSSSMIRRAPNHFDTLQDAKDFIRKWESKELTRDYRIMKTRGHKPIKRKRR